ncbi:MAG: cobyric acid synthase [Deltaproteobacteria bacterium]|nr:cobyric acid synthase [Deltaproteobacteria bacterium]
MIPARHGGNVWQLAKAASVSVKKLLDFSANVNPLGLPDWLRITIDAAIGDLVHYPDPGCAELVESLAKHHGEERQSVLPGNGSAELLSVIPRSIDATRVLLPVPCYVDYRAVAESAGIEVVPLRAEARNGFRLDLSLLIETLRARDLVFIGQPNNPSGTALDSEALRGAALARAESLFVVDEAFIDFSQGVASLACARPRNVIVIRSFTKIFAIPGLRLGYALAAPEIIARMREQLPPWSVNHLAQRVGVAAIEQGAEYLERTRALVSEQRGRLSRALAAIKDLTVYPSEANFILLGLERDDLDAERLAARLLASDGIAIRACANVEGLGPSYFRVAVRQAEDNERLCDALQRALNPRNARCRRASIARKPALMFQGTSSGAGKSLLTAAFCRILLEDGYRVAPFKSQNMSLNSFVTRDGGEMGRAQVVQAQACRLQPDVRMNPILLKPNSDTGAQVIVLGKPVANMNVERYIRYKPEAFIQAKQAYDDLAAENDVMVLEGAGSPAEVNLARHDIANMGMARHANARVLIVGDIDRGGVFAAFAGTMQALGESDRSRVSGFVVNRFRGRAELLDDALAWVLRATGLPVLGVVPYLARLGLPEEDSVVFDQRERDSGPAGDGAVSIGVVQLPHISNFTDFDALESEPDVWLRFLKRPEQLDGIDALLIPGSKNVMADAAFFRESGWSEAISALAKKGIEIVGVCGGFQLLGKEIDDPHGIECAKRSERGLGLLPVRTTLEAEKILCCVEARHLGTGYYLRGYEIHHGRTEVACASAVIERSDGEILGVRDASGRVWGSYLHGLFDADDFRRFFVNGLRRRRGLEPLASGNRYDIEPDLKRLADAVRSNLDIGLIYREIGLR